MNSQHIIRNNQRITEELLYLHNSKRNQLRILTNWLFSLLAVENRMHTRVHVMEMGAQLLMTASNIPVIGTEPSFFMKLLACIDAVNERIPGSFSMEEISRAKNHLHICLWTQHCYLGEAAGKKTDGDEDGNLKTEAHPSDAARNTNDQQHRTIQSGTSPIISSIKQRRKIYRQFSSERERLDRNLEMLRADNDADAHIFQCIAEDWDRRLLVQAGSVNIPLIEEDMTGGLIHDFYPFGTVSELFNTISPLDKGAGKDVILITDGKDASVHTNIHDTLQITLDALRANAPTILRNYEEQFYRLTSGYSDASMQYTGCSLGLGAAVNLISLLTLQRDGRTYQTVQPSTVFTGCIDAGGNLEPMNDEQINLKVKTVFFSPFSSLVFPKANEQTAQAALEALNAEYPNRKLELVPVKNMRDVFFSRHAIDVQYRTLWKRTALKIKRHLGKIAIGSLVMCVLMVAIYFFMIADFDNNPARVDIDKKYFIIQNVNKKELWRKLINPPDGSELENEPDPRERKHWFAIKDINGDGLNEVFLTHTIAKKGFSDRVRCYNADGSIRWLKHVGRPTLTRENDYSTQPFAVSSVFAEQTKAQEKPLIFTIARNDFYAYFINTFNCFSEIKGEYYHTGRITSFENLKPRVTHGNEVLFTGRHNGFLKPCVFILDMDHLIGKCPQETTHELLSPEIPNACEKYYILFPTLDIQDSLHDWNNQVATIASIDSNIMIQVDVAYMIPPLQKRVNQTASIYYVFDSNMNPVGVNSSTDFDNLFEHLFKNGQITSVWNEQYRKNLMRNILYWDGEKFVNTPTINKRYVEVINRKSP